MRTVFTILLILTRATGFAQADHYWYRVIATTNPATWDTATNIHLSDPSSGYAYSVSGITNYNATMLGAKWGEQLHIPKYEGIHIPSNGKWIKRNDITISADGRITDSLLELRVYLKKDSLETWTEIKAIRWNDELERAQDERLYGAYRDTIVDSVVYKWILYHRNRKVLEMGQDYTNRIRNGRWIYMDSMGKLQKIAYYVNDTLHGRYTEGFSGTRTDGLYFNGKKAGRWVDQVQQSKRRWFTRRVDMYDMDGTLVSKREYFGPGLGSTETFYSKKGEHIWYTEYDADGTIIYEGKGLRGILL